MQHFGDSVTVTTFLGIPDADEDKDSEDEVTDHKKRRGEGKFRLQSFMMDRFFACLFPSSLIISVYVRWWSSIYGAGVDMEQLRAGSLSHFKHVVGANMPAKKKKKTKANTSGSFQPKKGGAKKSEVPWGKGVKGRHAKRKGKQLL